TLTLYFWSAYQHPRANSIWKNILKIFFTQSLVGSIITGSIYILLIQFGVGENFPRSAFAVDLGISLLLFISLRLCAYLFANPNIRQAESPVSQLKSNWKKWLNEGLVFYGVLGGLLIFYMLFNHFIFVTSSPVSGQIKRWWGSLANSAYDRPTSDWNSYFGTGVSGLEAWEPFTEIFWSASNYLRPILPGADKLDERFYIAVAFFIVVSFILLILNKQKLLPPLQRLDSYPS
ncbi:MAG: hypothetical protein HC797_07300, partial [Anaerolineales bacterium]|nr:hypothetical protein [Anaerolineales bacterium]